ncbi:MAG: arginyl-tRNA synthetase [Myxococcales bacterium]|nr:arginyl-tRNA synthetase [Myxococcales bacterium]
MPSHHTPLHAAAAEVVAAYAGIPATELKVEATPRPELGDFAIGCFAIAKATQRNPAQVAQEIAAAFKPTALLDSATAAGPFVNFRANRAATFTWLVDAALRGTLLPRVGEGQTVCIDYSSPNVSKHLAYHHIRSTMIGHSLAQSHRALGFRVIGINHLGDWGTTHGMLIAAYKMWGAPEPLTVDALNDLYVRFREAMKTDASLEDTGRAWFKKLEDGDPEARSLWERFREISLAEYNAIYERLGIEFDEIRGESAYEADLPRVMKELTDRGLVVESEGALVVHLPDEKTPILLQKRDGATLYATRDVATAEYRWNTYHPARSLYVVDRGQALHFRQLFKLLAMMGYAWSSVCQHVPFGLVRIGGKKTGTRTGNVVLLKEVIGEAEARVRALIAETNPDLPADVLDRVAPMVGTGAVVFANLAPQREKDVDFEWEKVVAMQGDSGPYLQYSYARCASIARKANEPITSTSGIDFGKLAHDAEWAVARKLLEFPDVVVRSAEACEPHVIAHYLLDLAGEFSRWYTAGNGDASLRVLTEDAPTRRARLALVAAVQSTMREGLSLLGMAAPDQM